MQLRDTPGEVYKTPIGDAVSLQVKFSFISISAKVTRKPYGPGSIDRLPIVRLFTVSNGYPETLRSQNFRNFEVAIVTTDESKIAIAAPLTDINQI